MNYKKFTYLYKKLRLEPIFRLDIENRDIISYSYPKAKYFNIIKHVINLYDLNLKKVGIIYGQ